MQQTTIKFNNELEREEAIQEMMEFSLINVLSIEIGHNWWTTTNGLNTYRVSVQVCGEEESTTAFLLKFS
jgi:hypothetical protein